MIKNNLETIIDGNKVIYKKYFDVSIDLLFEAWSSQEHLSEWWGPDGFTLTSHSLDFTNGGIWDFIMHGPDGHDYKNRIQFIDIQKPRLIFYKHLGDGEGTEDVDFQTKIIFEEAGEGTNLTMEQIFPSKEELERVNKKYGAIEGGKQHVENLSKYLETLK
ncbi:SRPBCC family protein [Leptospira sp. 201903070]|uniref:SRPBCC family protein n=1 Tax=Leptospira ainlahdjerensis TaxID=2810033 RepID=A0ABS2UAV5_9LEPT|nr:SRPBCC family protein [Leptospira ainlahdjerensis]